MRWGRGHRSVSRCVCAPLAWPQVTGRYFCVELLPRLRFVPNFPAAGLCSARKAQHLCGRSLNRGEAACQGGEWR